MALTTQTLQRERDLATFDTEALAVWWVGSPDELAAKRRIAAAILQDEDFKKLGPIEDLYHLDKKGRYIRAAQRFAVVRQKMFSGAVAQEPYNIGSATELRTFILLALGPDVGTTGIQFAMFVPTLQNQTSKEQREAWLPAAQMLAILGAYGQA
jgi:hypothetical protein